MLNIYQPILDQILGVTDICNERNFVGCRRFAAVMMALAVLSVVASCSGTGGEATSSESASNGQYMQSVAYKDDARLTESYKQRLSEVADRTDFLKSAISDDVITADEMNEYQRRIQSCMNDNGFGYADLSQGSSSVWSLDGSPIDSRSSDEASARCGNDDYQIVRSVYAMAIQNPDDIDLKPYIVQCLVERNLVGEQYSTDDLSRDGRSQLGPYATRNDPSDPHYSDAVECLSDPLHNIADSR